MQDSTQILKSYDKIGILNYQTTVPDHGPKYKENPFSHHDRIHEDRQIDPFLYSLISLLQIIPDYGIADRGITSLQSPKMIFKNQTKQ